jgi:hypothetical protein
MGNETKAMLVFVAIIVAFVLVEAWWQIAVRERALRWYRTSSGAAPLHTPWYVKLFNWFNS